MAKSGVGSNVLSLHSQTLTEAVLEPGVGRLEDTLVCVCLNTYADMC